MKEEVAFFAGDLVANEAEALSRVDCFPALTAVDDAFNFHVPPLRRLHAARRASCSLRFRV